jgi:hypothetical protein
VLILLDPTLVTAQVVGRDMIVKKVIHKTLIEYYIGASKLVTYLLYIVSSIPCDV